MNKGPQSKSLTIYQLIVLFIIIPKYLVNVLTFQICPIFLIHFDIMMLYQLPASSRLCWWTCLILKFFSTCGSIQFFNPLGWPRVWAKPGMLATGTTIQNCSRMRVLFMQQSTLFYLNTTTLNANFNLQSTEQTEKQIFNHVTVTTYVVN